MSVNPFTYISISSGMFGDILGSHYFGSKENYFPLVILWCYAFGLHSGTFPKVSVWNSLLYLLLEWWWQLHLVYLLQYQIQGPREKYFSGPETVYFP